MNKLEFKVYRGKVKTLTTKKDIEAELRHIHKKYRQYKKIDPSYMYSTIVYMDLLAKYMERSDYINLPDFIVSFGVTRVITFTEDALTDENLSKELLIFIDHTFPVLEKLSDLNGTAQRYYDKGVDISPNGFTKLAALQGTDSFKVTPKFKAIVPKRSIEWVIIDKILSEGFHTGPLSVMAEFTKRYLPKLDKPYPLIEEYLTETSEQELAKTLSTVDKKIVKILSTYT